MIYMLPADAPSWRRIGLRDHLAALIRAYPGELQLNEVELAQAMAEEDGDGVPDTL